MSYRFPLHFQFLISGMYLTPLIALGKLIDQQMDGFDIVGHLSGSSIVLPGRHMNDSENSVWKPNPLELACRQPEWR